MEHSSFLNSLSPYSVILTKHSSKLSLYLTGSFFQHKQYPNVVTLNEFNAQKENPYFGKNSCSFTIAGEYYALGQILDSDTDQETYFLWKVGPTEIEPTDTGYFYVKNRTFGWKCSTLNDRGHMLLVQNDERSLVKHYIFDGNEFDSYGSSELKSRVSISGNNFV